MNSSKHKTCPGPYFITDELKDYKLREVLKPCPKFTDNSPEAIAARKHFTKLRKIMRLEHEAAGEEDW